MGCLVRLIAIDKSSDGSQIAVHSQAEAMEALQMGGFLATLNQTCSFLVELKRWGIISQGTSRTHLPIYGKTRKGYVFIHFLTTIPNNFSKVYTDPVFI